jgi:hypothetical protein
MNKRATAILAVILLCSLAITSVVFAQQQTKETCVLGWGNGCIIPRPVPPKPQYDVQMANGVAVDRYYLTTNPVLFVIFRYNYWNTKMYLIINGEFHGMEEIESRYDWNTNTRIFKYRDESGNDMVLTSQEFSDGISISAIYKNYIITFEPIRYGVVNSEPVIRETQITPIMPVLKQMTQSIGGKTGMTAENLISQAKPIVEWSEKGK